MSEELDIVQNPEERLTQLQEELAEIETENEEMEKQLRHERYGLALRQTLEQYPQLSEAIERSLQTPQKGPYHNEGPYMDAHLELIVGALYDICKGKFAEVIPADIRELITEVVVMEAPKGSGRKVPRTEMVEYAFLHDIAKPLCMSVGIAGRDDKIEISWEEWLEIEAKGEPYQIEVDGETYEIQSFSYYHESKEDAGKHGNVGADLVAASGADISPEILQTMRLHEVAYQFVKISAKTYEEHFVDPSFSAVQQNLIIAASYTDLMGSLNPDGQPELQSLIFLIQSRANLKLINEALAAGVLISENKVGKLKKADRVLTMDDIKEADDRKKLDINVLLTGLDQLVADGKLTKAQRDRILEIAQTEEAPLVVMGPEFGKQMKYIRPHLVQL
jgi:hypothetical protein